MTLRLDENRPSGTEATKGIVETPGDGDQLGLHSAVEVGTTKAGGTLKTAVLVEDDAFTQQRRPRQEVGEPCIAIAVFGEVHHCRPRSN